MEKQVSSVCLLRDLSDGNLMTALGKALIY